MILILNNALTRMGVIKNAIESTRLDELNGENTLDVKAVLDTKLANLVDENTVLELEDDYFDTAFFQKEVTEENAYFINLRTEHISYRLNKPEYDVEFFTEMGTPAYIAGKILEGTGFSLDTIDYTDVITYSAQEAKSRRQLLMEFVAYLGAEVSFKKFKVSILLHRGSTTRRPVLKDRDIRVISKCVDKHDLDENGNPKISYSCEPLCLPGTIYDVGDDILLINTNLGVRESLRVVRKSYNPYSESEMAFDFTNYKNGLSESLYRTITSTVIKDKFYNGTRIGPEFGFEAIRNDKKARSYFRSDGFAMQSGDGTGETWQDRLYYEYDAEKDETILVFDGKLTAAAIEALKANFDITISNTMIVNNLYSQLGRIADLTVSEVNTGWQKIVNYLKGDPSNINYIHIKDEKTKWITASITEIAPPTLLGAETDFDGLIITLIFDKAMSDPSGKQAQFNAVIDERYRLITSVASNADPTKIDLLISGSVMTNTSIVTVSYAAAGDIVAEDGGLLTSFSKVDVTNRVASPVPENQAWNGYPQTPVLTTDYPYQFINNINGYVYLIVGSVNSFYKTVDGIFNDGATNRYYILNGGAWLFQNEFTEAFTEGDLLQANNIIYLDNNRTITYFNKTT